MSSDVWINVVDPYTMAVVAEEWLGMSGTMDAARICLARPADVSRRGFESWSHITPAEARQIAEHSYADGASPEVFARLARAFPHDTYWWILVHGF